MNATFTNVKSNKFILIFAILQIFLSYTAENFSASKVALEMRSLRSGLNLAMSFTKPNKTSVWSVLSWASSMIITLKIWKRKIWIYVGSEYNSYLHEVLAELWLLVNHDSRFLSTFVLESQRSNNSDYQPQSQELSVQYLSL